MKRTPPLLPYYGSKWRLAPKYPKPIHDHIIEPFAGGAGYSLLYSDLKVTLIEKNEKAFGVLDFLIRASRSDILSIPLVGPGESVDDVIGDNPAGWLAGWWCNNGTATPCKKLSKWSEQRNRENSPRFWGRACRDRLADTSERISHWRVIHGDYSDTPIERATYFVDPPYQVAGKHYPDGSDAIDFDRLGDWCMGLPGQVIVCENDGAEWLPFKQFLSTAGAAKDGQKRKTSKEAIYIQIDGAPT